MDAWLSLQPEDQRIKGFGPLMCPAAMSLSSTHQLNQLVGTEDGMKVHNPGLAFFLAICRLRYFRDALRTFSELFLLYKVGNDFLKYSIAVKPHVFAVTKGSQLNCQGFRSFSYLQRSTGPSCVRRGNVEIVPSSTDSWGRRK